MREFSLQQLIPLLIFGAVLAFNHLGPILRRWLERQQEAAAAAERRAPSPPGAAPPVIIARRPERPERPARPARPARVAEVVRQRVSQEQPPLPASRIVTGSRRRHVPARALVSDRTRLREGIVVSVILGPCRAEQPYKPVA